MEKNELDAGKPRKGLPGLWGITDLMALQNWQGKEIEVNLSSGDELRGELVGYGMFTLTLKHTTGIIIVNKGNVAWFGERSTK